MKRWIVALLVILALAVPAQAQQIRKGNITTNGDIVAMGTVNTGNGSIQLSGSWTGTIEFEGTVEGTTWVSLTVTPFAGGAGVVNSITNGTWVVSNVLQGVRCRASAAMTGTAVCTILMK